MKRAEADPAAEFRFYPTGHWPIITVLLGTAISQTSVDLIGLIKVQINLNASLSLP